MSKKPSHNIKEEGFEIPDGYFEGFEERLFAKMSKERLPEESGLKVPEDYFEDLTKRLMQQIEEPKVVQLSSRKKYYYAITAVAASLVIFFGVRAFFTDHQMVTFDNLALEELEHYFENEAHQLDSYDIAEVFDTDELSMTDMITESYSDEELINYLNEEVDIYDTIVFEN